MLISLVLCIASLYSDEPAWKTTETGVKAKLRGVSALNDGPIYASGTAGTVIKSNDGGITWSRLSVPDAERLDFRDVEAIDGDVALLMAAGPGEASRIYKTTDGGRTWDLKFRQANPKGFLDAIALFNDKQAIALGDPLDGRFQILKSDDAGETWQPIAGAGMPEALANEGCFAASGTCLVAGDDGLAWFGTGSAKVSRVFRSSDFGKTWSAAETPVEADSASKGIFGLSFNDPLHGFAIGGDYKAIEKPGPLLARTDDGGASWKLVESGPKGFREAVRVVPETKGQTLFAVGPAGSEVSVDAGLTWEPVGERGFHAAAGFRRNGESWGIAVGDDGKAAIRRFPRLLPKQADRDSR